jgi:hypothetical protein
LLGCEPAELVTVESLVNDRDVEDLHYPADRLLSRQGLRGLYLANFLPWDSRRYSEEMVARFGAHCARNHRTFDTYDRIDDMTYMTVHDMLKFSKLGYSRVTDNLCREIRFGRITREDALVIERYCQAEVPEAEIASFCAWLGISVVGFHWLGKQIKTDPADLPVRPTLSDRQARFVDSFLTNAPAVAEGGTYTVYGKGLHI